MQNINAEITTRRDREAVVGKPVWKPTTVRERAMIQLAGVENPTEKEIKQAEARFVYLDEILSKIERINLDYVVQIIRNNHPPFAHVDLNIRYGFRGWNPMDIGLSYYKGDFSKVGAKNGIVVFSADDSKQKRFSLTEPARDVGAEFFCELIENTPAISFLKATAIAQGLHVAIQTLPVSNGFSTAEQGLDAGKYMRLLLTISEKKIERPIRSIVLHRMDAEKLRRNEGPVVGIDNIISQPHTPVSGWLQRLLKRRQKVLAA